MDNTIDKVPAGGWAGLKAHWKSDAISGFLVFLLALPLSLGIAKASDFPPIMGLLTVMVGGLVVRFVSGAPMAIKGPAAGLIVIVSGAVADFGGGSEGWRLTLGAIVVAGVFQVVLGLLRLGRFTDIFPLSAIQGMLASIGLLILSRQVHVLLNTNPALLRGKDPFALLAQIPQSIKDAEPRGAFIGLVSLAIMLGWPYLRSKKLRQVPAPLAVLLFAVPAQLLLHMGQVAPAYSLVQVGAFTDSLGLHVSFDGWQQGGTFVRYVAMLALVGSLESLLIVRAIDLMDPWRRRSDANKELVGLGLGNIVAGVLGGLPMITEVARSSANVASGGRTAWANFFHGLWMLLFVLLAAPLIELIPNAALAAMLITVGIRLAHPRELVRAFRIGREQLLVLLLTIIITLATDLLVGIIAGMLCEMAINILLGKPLSALFKAPTEVSFTDDRYEVTITKAAVFSNFMGIKRKLDALPPGFPVVINLEETALVDHSVMENLQRFKKSYESQGGTVNIVGLHHHQPLSDHQSATRKRAKPV